MKSVNEVMLLGNVGKDPEIRATSGGTRIASLTLATNRRVKDEERTDWHRLTVFGKLVDVVEQWVHKGDRLYVRGRLEYGTVDKDGEKRYYTDIVVQDLVMLGARSGSAEPREEAPPTRPRTGDDPDSDLPF